MYSYNIEQASGHGGHNIVTVIMNEKRGRLGRRAQLARRVSRTSSVQFPGAISPASFLGAAVDADVNTFVERLAYWIRGIDCWSLETERYFGTKGLEIKEHRQVRLLPKVKKPDVTPMMAQLNA
jgi:hypothetical protein